MLRKLLNGRKECNEALLHQLPAGGLLLSYWYPMSDSYKGYISTEKTIWCGVCSVWDQVASGGHVKHWKKAGWKKTRMFGWVCPKHVDERKST